MTSKSLENKIEELNPHIVTRLVSGGFISLNQNGEINSASIEKLGKLMETHYFVVQRSDYLIEQANITRGTFNVKLYSSKSSDIKKNLINLGDENYRGTSIYTYKKEDEPKLIEALRNRLGEHPASPNSYRTRRRINDTNVGGQHIKLSEVAKETFLSSGLLEEVLEKIHLSKSTVSINGMEIPVMDRDDYQTLRKYLWDVRQLDKTPDFSGMADYIPPKGPILTQKYTEPLAESEISTHPFDSSIDFLKRCGRKKVAFEEITCDMDKGENRMISIWKIAYLDGTFVPAPIINEKNEVVCFWETYWVAKAFGLKEISVMTLPAS